MPRKRGVTGGLFCDVRRFNKKEPRRKSFWNERSKKNDTKQPAKPKARRIAVHAREAEVLPPGSGQGYTIVLSLYGAGFWYIPGTGKVTVVEFAQIKVLEDL